MIRIVSVALPKSPTNLAQGDEVPQIITPITRQRPSEILHLLQNDFCNNLPTRDNGWLCLACGLDPHPALPTFRWREFWRNFRLGPNARRLLKSRARLR